MAMRDFRTLGQVVLLAVGATACGGRPCRCQADICTFQEIAELREDLMKRANNFLNQCPFHPEEALKLLQPHEALYSRCGGSVYARYLSIQAGALCSLGRNNEARPLIDKIDRIEQTGHLRAQALDICINRTPSICKLEAK